MKKEATITSIYQERGQQGHINVQAKIAWIHTMTAGEAVDTKDEKTKTRSFMAEKN